MDRAVTSLPSSAPTTLAAAAKRLNVLERYLSLWVGLCMVVGVVANLDWIETTGVLVEQFDPSTAQQAVAKRPAVQQIVSADGDRCLPLILVNESVMSRGRSWSSS
jgi:arsenical resistance operon trans-acting repressor ArsD